MFTLGRLGKNEDGVVVPIDGVGFWRVSGNTVRVEGLLHAQGMNEEEKSSHILACRNQLMGYINNNDEPFVPVTYDEDPSENGFYQVLNGEVGFEKGSLGRSSFPFSVELHKLNNYSISSIESIVRGWIRRNDHGLTDTQVDPWIGIPDNFGQISMGNAGVILSSNTRESSTGDVMFAIPVSFAYIASYTLLPEDFYAGSVVLEMPYQSAGCAPGDEATLAVVGTRMPWTGNASSWRISNGLIRVESAGGANPGYLSISAFDGSDWLGPKEFKIGAVAGVTFIEDWNYLAILQNSPELVVLRLGGSLTGGYTGRILVDIQLRKGSRYIELTMQGDALFDWSVAVVTPEAATALTGGLYATSYDSDGLKYVLCSSKAINRDLTNGSIKMQTQQFLGDFGISFEFDGGHSNDAAQNVIYQYHAVGSERILYAAQEVTL